MKSSKGFTLIELLAVIIILGVLMIIAIPSVTTYIQESRKSAYISTVKDLINGSRNLVNSGKLQMYATDTSYYILGKCIPTENANESPFGDFVASYIIVNYNGDGYEYYWTGVDSSGVGISKIVIFSDLDPNLIETDLELSDIPTLDSVNNRTKVAVLSDDCTHFEDKGNAIMYRFESSTRDANSCTLGIAFSCDRSKIDEEYISNCESYYEFETEDYVAEQNSSCSGTTSFTCDSSHVGDSYTTSTFQSYSLKPVTTSAGECTSSSSFSCNNSNLGRSYVSCSVGSSTFASLTSNVNECVATSSFTCTPETNGNTYQTCESLPSGKYRRVIYTCNSAYNVKTYTCKAVCNVSKKTCTNKYHVTTQTCKSTGN